MDLVVTNLTQYSPVMSRWNGITDGQGFGSFEVDGKENRDESINEITLKFELHIRPEGSGALLQEPEPVHIPYLKFSLFDFDHANSDADGAEVSRAPWRCR